MNNTKDQWFGKDLPKFAMISTGNGLLVQTNGNYYLNKKPITIDRAKIILDYYWSQQPDLNNPQQP